MNLHLICISMPIDTARWSFVENRTHHRTGMWITEHETVSTPTHGGSLGNIQYLTGRGQETSARNFHPPGADSMEDFN